jgi:hypothetical protein
LEEKSRKARIKKFVATAKLYFLIKLIVGEQAKHPKAILILDNASSLTRTEKTRGEKIENILMRYEECGWKNYELDIKSMSFI